MSLGIRIELVDDVVGGSTCYVTYVPLPSSPSDIEVAKAVGEAAGWFIHTYCRSHPLEGEDAQAREGTGS